MKGETPAYWLGAMLAELRRCSSILWRWEAQFKGVQFEGRCLFQGRPIISRIKGGRIVIGDEVNIASSVRNNTLGLFQPSVLRALAPGARLVLGEKVGMSGAVFCAGLSIEVGVR